MTAKYPSDDDFYAEHSEDQIVGLISALPAHEAKQTVATIDLEALPDDADRISVLMVWATFADVMQDLIPEITIATGTSLFHEKNDDQKRKTIIRQWKSAEYYRRQQSEGM